MKSPLTWGTDSGCVNVGFGTKCSGTKHGMEMTKRTCLHGSTCQIINTYFLFSAPMQGGGEYLWSFGQRSRLVGRSCAAILHN